MTRKMVGTGSHVYEVIHPFGTLPPGMTFANTSHVATDSLGRVYVYQRKDPPILVFDGDGNLLTTWGDGQLMDGHGIYITPDDEIFLIDRDAHEVLKYNTDGQVLLRIGSREKPSLQAPFNHPADIAIAQNGDIFVADGYGNSSVHRFSGDGKHLNSWGSWGSGPGQFITPHGIWVDGQNRVYVCDRENNRVQLFSLDGDYITEWTGFFHPMDIFMDTQGIFYVTDQVPGMTMLKADGSMIDRIRTPVNGHGMWIDTKGNMYTAGNEGLVAKYTIQ